MTDEKKEFCFPRVIEDVKNSCIIIVAILVGVVGLIIIPYYIGTLFVTERMCCQHEPIEHPCGDFDYWLFGLMGTCVGIFILYAMLQTLISAYKRYWITGKECYEDKK